jgi:hypothetical protein
MWEVFKLMQNKDTKETYELRKEAQKQIWLSKVFAHSGDADQDALLKEALEKFHKNYPPYEE